MMTATIALTGGNGFLGWHIRVLARALGLPAPIVIGRDALASPDRLAALISGVDRVLHVAGVNRGQPDDVATGNVTLARRLAAGMRACQTPPKRVVFANSVQAGNGTPYGEGKATTAAVLSEATRWLGSAFDDILLPNLFGEHGRPNYNSVIATFSQVLADGGEPRVDGDRELELLHATDAAALLLGTQAPDLADGPTPTTRRTVRQLADQLKDFSRIHRTGEIPALLDRFDVRLFNTYRSHGFPASSPIPLTRHTDDRGGLVEVVKVHGGGGQTSCSSTVPGVTRGQHFHLAKVERFAVMRGDAEICLRRCCTMTSCGSGSPATSQSL